MAEKPTVYIETTIPSFLTAWPSNDLIAAGKQEVTRQWWKRKKGDFELFASQYVIDEAERGDPDAAQQRLAIIHDLDVLEVDPKVIELSEIILATGLIPAKAKTDAAHIAVATRHSIDFLLTWNCVHIANAQILRRIDRIVAEAGFVLPTICTPDELFGGDEDEN